MTAQRPVIDAGPALNFFSINKQRLLIGVLGPLCAPETVRDEVLRKAQREEGRFGHAAVAWSKLGHYMQILSDEWTDDLARAVSDVAGMPMADRMKTSRDLGEIMVIAHALIAAKAGAEVTVLIDDGAGRQLASAQRSRLKRLREAGNPRVGRIALIGTVTVLKLAAQHGQVAGKGEMREIYARLRCLDDGLVPIERSGLLDAGLWHRPHP
ncbi:hypothetical protein GCM10009715_31440 [Paeniglutamicibacter psychrophenolicus]|uniref:DUF3800 domain-containing protein n=1 Tax=Paeniglutamicibacter psychrophenolicus TaxID=257454 RepID=A0ABS4W964_9MICC|nr:hypothetical protein [Paeniglutamicibacter psychrophenolicus]MBP2372734.1 hypothetical protein [Paeniglutamicibacter psychrophenolicus]